MSYMNVFGSDSRVPAGKFVVNSHVAYFPRRETNPIMIVQTVAAALHSAAGVLFSILSDMYMYTACLQLIAHVRSFEYSHQTTSRHRVHEQATLINTYTFSFNSDDLLALLDAGSSSSLTPRAQPAGRRVPIFLCLDSDFSRFELSTLLQKSCNVRARMLLQCAGQARSTYIYIYIQTTCMYIYMYTYMSTTDAFCEEFLL